MTPATAATGAPSAKPVATRETVSSGVPVVGDNNPAPVRDCSSCSDVGPIGCRCEGWIPRLRGMS